MTTLSTSAVPLQNRTTAQLKAGLHVKVLQGAPQESPKDPAPTPADGSRATLAAARLVQDAAEYVASTSGVKPSLTNVYVGDDKPDHRTWAGYAWFDNGKDGSFALTKNTSDDLIKGVQRLTKEPFDTWGAHD